MDSVPQLAAPGEPLVRRTQVEEQLNGLEVNAEDLANMVDVIEKRLQSVIQPMKMPAPEKPNQPRPLLVPLATRIEQSVDKIRYQIDRLRELNANIELTE